MKRITAACAVADPSGGQQPAAAGRRCARRFRQGVYCSARPVSTEDTPETVRARIAECRREAVRALERLAAEQLRGDDLPLDSFDAAYVEACRAIGAAAFAALEARESLAMPEDFEALRSRAAEAFELASPPLGEWVKPDARAENAAALRGLLRDVAFAIDAHRVCRENGWEYDERTDRGIPAARLVDAALSRWGTRAPKRQVTARALLALLDGCIGHGRKPRGAVTSLDGLVTKLVTLTGVLAGDEPSIRAQARTLVRELETTDSAPGGRRTRKRQKNRRTA